MAGHTGFEPVPSDLESDMLPLTLMTYMRSAHRLRLLSSACKYLNRQSSNSGRVERNNSQAKNKQVKPTTNGA